MADHFLLRYRKAEVEVAEPFHSEQDAIARAHALMRDGDGTGFSIRDSGGKMLKTETDIRAARH